MIYAHLIGIVFVTFKIKNAILRWLFVFYPVTWLYFLFEIRFDIFSCLLVWMPALAGVATLVILLFIDIARKQGGETLSYYKTRFVRPCLALTVLIISLFAHNCSRTAADLYAIETAKKIQAISQIHRTCPFVIEDWVTDESDCYIMYGKFGPDFPITYSAIGNTFQFHVRHSMDDRFYVEGGVDKKLKAYRVIDGMQTDYAID